ncbi:MAG: glycosyltransferase family 39 protein [Bradyrhizobiaceae bacterium]|nr:glycosyltransferase family 39 protein [Bradyrhizobiaceae bacterium]
MRAAAFTSPLEASIYVEGLRARPAFFVGLLLIVHAVLWTLTAWIANPTPDPNLTVGLALGRELQLGYLGLPPLGPWVLEIAYRAGGLLAAYALGPATVALTGWVIFLFARRIVGDRHGALAVFLMVGVHPVAFPVGAFDSDLVQMPLVAAAVLAWWHAVVHQNRLAWIALGLAFGATAYAGPQGLFVFLALLALTAATSTGRAALQKNESQIAAVAGLFLFTLLLTPRLIWLQYHGFDGVLPAAQLTGEAGAMSDAIFLAAFVLVGHVGLLIMVALASRWFASDGEIAPVFMRPPLEDFGRRCVLVIALVPPLLALAAAAYFGGRYTPGAAAPLVLYSGLLVIVLTGDALRVHRQRLVAVAALTLLILPPVLDLATAFSSPWVGERGRATNWPAASAARYITDVYRTRTGKPLEYVVGEVQTASAIALLSRDRPHVFIDADSARAPWADRNKLEAAGGVVIWPARGADASPPAALAANLPPLVPEAPLTLRWVRPGNLDFIRLGWAIVPPKP